MHNVLCIIISKTSYCKYTFFFEKELFFKKVFGIGINFDRRIMGGERQEQGRTSAPSGRM